MPNTMTAASNTPISFLIFILSISFSFLRPHYILLRSEMNTRNIKFHVKSPRRAFATGRSGKGVVQAPLVSLYSCGRGLRLGLPVRPARVQQAAVLRIRRNTACSDIATTWGGSVAAGVSICDDGFVSSVATAFA
jgi:hypothetical protein